MVERNIRVQALDRNAVEDQQIEIVERKGIGHPDSICDGVAESVSRALAREYIDRVGKVLHYNTDETQLVAGNAAPKFSGGEVLQPIYLLIVGRATKTYEGTRFPAERIALKSAKDYLCEHIPALDIETDIVVDVKFGEGSGDLQTVFGDAGVSVPMANDTSFGVGHAPYTETEEIVLNVERRLNQDLSADDPAIGPDIKIMAKRENDTIDLTVAAAIIDQYVSGLEEYQAKIERVESFVHSVAGEYTDRDVNVFVNTADDIDAESVYLTVTGTSAEQGDDGSVGRGNRANGLITPNRSMSMEATSGKNPVNHIGKIYNLLSTDIAHTVVEETPSIRDLRIRLLSQIGRPIDEPHIADAFVVTDGSNSVAAVEDDIIRVIDEELADVTSVTERVIHGELQTF